MSKQKSGKTATLETENGRNGRDNHAKVEAAAEPGGPLGLRHGPQRAHGHAEEAQADLPVAVQAAAVGGPILERSKVHTHTFALVVAFAIPGCTCRVGKTSCDPCVLQRLETKAQPL